MTDLLGKMVLKQHVEVGSSSVRINSSVLKKGIYLVRYENINTVSKPVKLVIE
ncbi:MAG TPA: T9SS type A sorting domain-containing protein [Bacteroidia bacterium]|nr:T9SS type A sorting domain-containing protein [Bacteroidia bacterium]